MSFRPALSNLCVEPNSSKQTIVTGTLSIRRVLPAHFREKFYCVGTRRYGDSVSITVHLKPRPSVASLAAAGTCVFLLFVLMAVMVKCFAVDLVLLFRRLFPFRLEDAGLKMFDAYVVYQLHSQDKLIEEALARFVSQDLPHVLEDKCGYKLFIHGRDDLPGEDHVELVEERMRKSRRLMVILTPGSGSEVTDTYQLPEGYDWQVGLHQALVHRDLSVILIQLGNTSPREYSHLPLALQHLIQRGAPIRWPQEQCTTCVNSRFWKNVRYLMPATPVTTYDMSTL
ncbi:interleukin-1 receptor-like 1 [Eucyclogobius newberryi]|uniref:interleukin-1 receptor-like 1 n=1 Tax=Eucyclogobius newberryi TaxID=166745 RepID=UPI003B5AC95D